MAGVIGFRSEMIFLASNDLVIKKQKSKAELKVETKTESEAETETETVSGERGRTHFIR